MIQQVTEQGMAGAREEARERCKGCGKGPSHRVRLDYEMPHEDENIDPAAPPYLYCTACYQEFRAFYEEPEDNIIAALKSHHLHERYTLPYLRAALESLGTVSDEAFAAYLEKGTVSFFRPRSNRPTD